MTSAESATDDNLVPRGYPTFHDIPGSTVKYLEETKNDTHAVTIINIFVLKSANEIDAFLENWLRDGNFMKRQYGMLSAQLHRGVGEESSVFVNVVQWESTKAFRDAFENPEFQGHLDQFPAATHIYPLLLKKVYAPNICVA